MIQFFQCGQSRWTAEDMSAQLAVAEVEGKCLESEKKVQPGAAWDANPWGVLVFPCFWMKPWSQRSDTKSLGTGKHQLLKMPGSRFLQLVGEKAQFPWAALEDSGEASGRSLSGWLWLLVVIMMCEACANHSKTATMIIPWSTSSWPSDKCV